MVLTGALASELRHLAHRIAEKASKTAVCDQFIVSLLCDKRVCSCIREERHLTEKKTHTRHTPRLQRTGS
jgi:hypothetical protein